MGQALHGCGSVRGARGDPRPYRDDGEAPDHVRREPIHRNGCYRAGNGDARLAGPIGALGIVTANCHRRSASAGP